MSYFLIIDQWYSKSNPYIYKTPPLLAWIVEQQKGVLYVGFYGNSAWTLALIFSKLCMFLHLGRYAFWVLKSPHGGILLRWDGWPQAALPLHRIRPWGPRGGRLRHFDHRAWAVFLQATSCVWVSALPRRSSGRCHCHKRYHDNQVRQRVYVVRVGFSHIDTTSKIFMGGQELGFLYRWRGVKIWTGGQERTRPFFWCSLLVRADTIWSIDFEKDLFSGKKIGLCVWEISDSCAAVLKRHWHLRERNGRESCCVSHQLFWLSVCDKNKWKYLLSRMKKK